MHSGYAEVRHALKFLPGLKIGTYVWEPDSDRLVWSDEMVTIYGLDRAPATAAEFKRLIHREDHARVEREGPGLIGPENDVYSHSFRIVRPDGEVRVILDRGTIERDAAGRIQALRGVNVDVTDEAHLNYSAEIRLRASEDRYRKLFDAIDAGFCIVEVSLSNAEGRTDYRVVEANPAFYRQTGFPGEITDQWLRSAVPDLEEHWYEAYSGVARTGQPARFENHSLHLGRWFDVYAFRLDDPDGKLRVGILFTDITGRKTREAEAQLIVDEISHRSKNLLGVVQVIAQQSANSPSEDFLTDFGNRVQAMAASHDLLMRNDWSTVSLVQLVRSQLLPFFDLSNPRIVLDGPEVSLTPVATKALGMALHELATNAVKYGAMSNDAGRVRISWTVEPGPGDELRFTLSWVERDGPRVAGPERRGFGSKVTTWMVEANTRGKVAVDYAPEGLSWRLTCDGGNVLSPGLSEAADQA